MESLAGGTGWLKAGFLGFQGSGKTYTAMLLARAVQERMGLTGKIAMFDTEGGSAYIAPKVEELTGHELVGVRARSFQAMMDFAMDCEKDPSIDVAIFDAMTHPWRELMTSFLAKLNKQRKRRNKPGLARLPFQMWGPLKETWNTFTDWYLNSDMHCIICGRAGYNYDYVENEETEKLELRKTGIKMKTETEFGFEPSLLVEMSRVGMSAETAQFTRNALIVKDRFGVIDGREFVFGSVGLDEALKVVGDAFGPHLDLLIPGAHAPVDTASMTEPDLDDEGDNPAKQYAVKRDILLEEIRGLLTATWGSNSKESKAIVLKVFGTYSKTKIDKMRPEELQEGLEKLRVLKQEKEEQEAEKAKEKEA